MLDNVTLQNQAHVLHWTMYIDLLYSVTWQYVVHKLLTLYFCTLRLVITLYT